MKPEECKYIQTCAVQIIGTYINSRVESVGYLMQNPDQDGSRPFFLPISFRRY